MEALLLNTFKVLLVIAIVPVGTLLWPVVVFSTSSIPTRPDRYVASLFQYATQVSFEGKSGGQIAYLFLTSLVAVVSMLVAVTFAILTVLGIGN